jgi:hypothetical protein
LHLQSNQLKNWQAGQSITGKVLSWLRLYLNFALLRLRGAQSNSSCNKTFQQKKSIFFYFDARP